MGLGQCVACILVGGVIVLGIVGMCLPETRDDMDSSGHALRGTDGQLTCAFVNHHRLGDWTALDKHMIATHELVQRVIACNR